MLDIDRNLEWSQWQPHQGCWRGCLIPNVPGLYRLRRVGQAGLDYIGQTGKGEMTLRKRLGMQRGVYADQMPYKDPHTAAPALWALRRMTCTAFEVSVACVPGTVQWRKGMESVAIALHRQEFRQSPTANFGRMPIGFSRSSGNNRRLVLAGKRFRGAECDTEERHHSPGVPPAGLLTGDPQDIGWNGQKWSEWHRLVGTSTDLPSPSALGLYRIREAAKPGLIYVGEGIVAARLVAHWRKTMKAGHPQGDVFRSAERLECSWVLNDCWLPHQRQELECDLIGSHLLTTGAVPDAQFIG
jgi:hypothetical protein